MIILRATRKKRTSNREAKEMSRRRAQSESMLGDPGIFSVRVMEEDVVEEGVVEIRENGSAVTSSILWSWSAAHDSKEGK